MKRSCVFACALLAISIGATAQTITIDNTAATLSNTSEAGGVPILMYHGLDATHGYDPAGFDAQMDYLANNDFTCITLDHLRSWIVDGTPALPAKPVIITFDDNYITVYSHAYPKMKALSDAGETIFGYNFAHTLYVGVAPGGSPATGFDHADWAECILMESNGILYTESHTVTHQNLTSLTDTQETNEIVNSKADIETNMPGKTVKHLAYPFGAYDSTTITKTENAGYETGLSTISGHNTRSTPLYELRRYNVNPSMFTNSTFTGYLNGTSTGTSWIASTGAPGYVGTNYHYTNPGSGSSTATWEFVVGTTGTYDVSANWAAAFNRATDAPYTVHHEGGTTTVRVNQQTNGGTYNSLGQYQFTSGTLYRVVLSNDANGLVIADAVRISQASSVSDWMLYLN